MKNKIIETTLIYLIKDLLKNANELPIKNMGEFINIDGEPEYDSVLEAKAEALKKHEFIHLKAANNGEFKIHGLFESNDTTYNFHVEGMIGTWFLYLPEEENEVAEIMLENLDYDGYDEMERDFNKLYTEIDVKNMVEAVDGIYSIKYQEKDEERILKLIKSTELDEDGEVDFTSWDELNEITKIVELNDAVFQLGSAGCLEKIESMIFRIREKEASIFRVINLSEGNIKALNEIFKGFDMEGNKWRIGGEEDENRIFNSISKKEYTLVNIGVDEGVLYSFASVEGLYILLTTIQDSVASDKFDAAIKYLEDKFNFGYGWRDKDEIE